jgi:hypothetical protein
VTSVCLSGMFSLVQASVKDTSGKSCRHEGTMLKSGRVRSMRNGQARLDPSH